MEWATLRASIDLAFNTTSNEIRLLFVGGEPLLEWPKIRKAVAYADRTLQPGKSVRYYLSTNGLLITDEIADFLNEHLFELQLSFDGIPRVQDYRRKGTFAIIDQLLDRLRKRQPNLFRNRVHVGTTLIPATIPYLADSIRYLMKKGIRRIGLHPSLTPSRGWTDEGVQALDNQFGRIYDDSLRHFEKTGEVPLRLFHKGAEVASGRVTSRNMCRVGAGETLAVDVDGQAYGCVMFAESYQKFPSEFLKRRLAPLRMGDVRDPRFWERHAAFPKAARKAEIFHEKGKKYSRYGKCGDCPYLDHCSICPISIGYDPSNTDPLCIPDFICAFNMVALKYRARFGVTSFKSNFHGGKS